MGVVSFTPLPAYTEVYISPIPIGYEAAWALEQEIKPASS
jgi:hypothetical protein